MVQAEEGRARGAGEGAGREEGSAARALGLSGRGAGPRGGSGWAAEGGLGRTWEGRKGAGLGLVCWVLGFFSYFSFSISNSI